MAIDTWVRLPSWWIDNYGLARMSWHHGGSGSDKTAALMALTAIVHNADQQTGVARITYDGICSSTGLSRAKLSKGLDVLKRLEVVSSGPNDARSTYALCNYDTNAGWAKFPLKSMYSLGRIAAFDDFRLRRVVELDALKLFFLFIARRGRDTNLANIGYGKIEEYTNVRRIRIKTALSFLASLSLVHIERVASRQSEWGVSNAYRVVGIEPYKHMGTRGRKSR